jgi:hypothetical protein
MESKKGYLKIEREMLNDYRVLLPNKFKRIFFADSETGVPGPKIPITPQ